MYEDVTKNRFKEWGAFFAVTSGDVNIPQEDRKHFFHWLREANNNKNRGFYVDWSNNTILTPSDWGTAAYEKALAYATSLQKQTEMMKSVDLNDDEIAKFLDSEPGID